MTDSIRQHLDLHASALGLRARRSEILASNLANAATPGFKARDFDFGAAFQAARGSGPMRTTDARHIATGGSTAAQLGYRMPTEMSLDGNTVEAGVEQMEFAENALRQQVSLTLLNRRISGLRSAIQGE